MITTYWALGVDAPESFKILPGGDMLAVGSTLNFGAGQDDVYLVRTDPNGNAACIGF